MRICLSLNPFIVFVIQYRQIQQTQFYGNSLNKWFQYVFIHIEFHISYNIFVIGVDKLFIIGCD